MNGLIIDIDDVADIEEGKKELEALPCARYIFRSPYNGIKVIIPFNRPVTDKDTYMTLWKYCALNILSYFLFILSYIHTYLYSYSLT